MVESILGIFVTQAWTYKTTITFDGREAGVVNGNIDVKTTAPILQGNGYLDNRVRTRFILKVIDAETNQVIDPLQHPFSSGGSFEYPSSSFSMFNVGEGRSIVIILTKSQYFNP